MIKIPLLNSKRHAYVDDCQYEKAMEFEWFKDSGGHARSNQHPQVSMPEFLFGKAPKGFQWDHENRNKLDNQRNNLRFATHAQNQRNKGRRKDNKSGFIGVYYYHTGKWLAYIHVDGARIYLGYHNTSEEAARVRDAAAFRHHREFAVLNFPIVRHPRLP